MRNSITADARPFHCLLLLRWHCLCAIWFRSKLHRKRQANDCDNHNNLPYKQSSYGKIT